MSDIRVGDLVRLSHYYPIPSLRDRVGIVRCVAAIGRRPLSVQCDSLSWAPVSELEIAAVKRGGQWLTRVDGVWSA